MTLTETMNALGARARAAYHTLSTATAEQKSLALNAAADALRKAAPSILAANAEDMREATGLTPSELDRLKLDEKRIESIAAGVATIARLPDPVGRVSEAWDVESNGLHIEKTAIPLGVIGMIYEARPNVTADAAALAIKAGNAVILRGGKETFRSAKAILAALHEGLRAAGLPEDAAQMVPTTDRAAVEWMLSAHEAIDVLIPRGGKSLTDRVRREARVPTLLHLDGNTHLYVHSAADMGKAHRIVMNAKLRRTGICGALETLLIDQNLLQQSKPILEALLEGGCELRGDAQVRALDARIKTATEEDWVTEYLAPILAVKVVSGLDDAIAHINRHGSHHTDGIITEDAAAATRFERAVDSAIVTHNASTQFADGGEFGFGAEIGIATGRLHARGPVGAAQLTTYKYVVTTKRPEGAIRAG